MVLELTTHVLTCAVEVLYKEDPECVLQVAGQNLTTPDLTCAVEVLYKEDPE